MEAGADVEKRTRDVIIGILRQGLKKCVWRCCSFFFFSSRRRHTRLQGDWSSDVCSSDLSAVAAARLPPLLSNTFNVPGTASDRARTILARSFGERPDGVFTVVFRVPPSQRARLERRLIRAARVLPTAHATQLRAIQGLLYGDVATTLDLQHAKQQTSRLRRALAGSPRAYVTGAPAIQHDLEPILSSDLRRGEALALQVGRED